MKSGLTSVTFRNKNIESIAAIAAKAGLEVIEWGSDVHCPPEDTNTLKLAAELTEKNSLSVSSYGTYFRLGVSPIEQFESLCDAAAILGTSIVRVWAFNKDPQDTADAEYENCVKDAKYISDIAKKHNITICFEYHRGTLTRSADSAKKLINDIARDNVRLYWQPNPDISHEQNCAELICVLPYVVNIHCFHWLKGNIRRPLFEGVAEWENYISIAKNGNVKSVILEFVMDEKEQHLLDDSATLKKLLS